ncbi:ANK_REP_REGION domain-containing protein [Durusdinium trenchii]|uniref:ANK_REP_REGION domain-containing protein n=1 Tax=Durusdinium trenchii TaxID=1381693 RepID=A0ABP0S3X9_9DINO
MPITREFVTVPKVRVGGRIDAWGSGKVVVNVSAVGIVVFSCAHFFTMADDLPEEHVQRTLAELHPQPEEEAEVNAIEEDSCFLSPEELLALCRTCAEQLGLVSPGTPGGLRRSGAFQLGAQVRHAELDVVYVLPETSSIGPFGPFLELLQQRLQASSQAAVAPCRSQGSLDAPGLRFMKGERWVQLFLAKEQRGLPSDTTVPSMAALHGLEARGDERKKNGLECSKQLPLKPKSSVHFATDVQVLNRCPGGNFSDHELSRADSFASTRASTGTSLSHGKSMGARETQRKMIVTHFLDANGFMHINEAKASWFGKSYPLHVAVRQNKTAVVKALLLLGAWREAKSRRGETAEELALRCQQRWGGYEEILRVFEEDKLRNQRDVDVDHPNRGTSTAASSSGATAASSSASGQAAESYDTRV